MPGKQKTNDDLWQLMTKISNGQQSMTSSLEDALKKMDNMEKKFEQKFASFEERLKQVENGSGSTDVQSIQEAITANVREEQERNNRRNNIVIFGIPEDERGGNVYSQLMTIIGDHLTTEPYYERIGGTNSQQPRPLRVFLPPGAKRQLLSNCKKLKDRPDLKTVSVCQDLTVQQQKAQKESKGKPVRRAVFRPRAEEENLQKSTEEEPATTQPKTLKRGLEESPEKETTVVSKKK